MCDQVMLQSTRWNQTLLKTALSEDQLEPPVAAEQEQQQWNICPAVQGRVSLSFDCDHSWRPQPRLRPL